MGRFDKCNVHGHKFIIYAMYMDRSYSVKAIQKRIGITKIKLSLAQTFTSTLLEYIIAGTN
jgi:hypothetical protein